MLKWIFLLGLALLFWYLRRNYASEKNYSHQLAKRTTHQTPQLFSLDGVLNEHGHGKHHYKDINLDTHPGANYFSQKNLDLGRFKKIDSTRVFEDGKQLTQVTFMDTGYSLLLITSEFDFGTSKENVFSQEFPKVFAMKKDTIELKWSTNIAFDKEYVAKFAIKDLGLEYSSTGKMDNDHKFHAELSVKAKDKESGNNAVDLKYSMKSFESSLEIKPLDKNLGRKYFYYLERYYSTLTTPTTSLPTLAVKEYKRAILPYLNHYSQCTGFAQVDNLASPVYFQMGTGLNADQSDEYSHADVGLIGGKEVHFLPVRIKHDPLNFMNGWTLTTETVLEGEEPQVNLSLVSVKYSPKSYSLMGIYEWKIEQVFGFWSGYITDSEGRRIKIENAIGMCETHLYRF